MLRPRTGFAPRGRGGASASLRNATATLPQGVAPRLVTRATTSVSSLSDPTRGAAMSSFRSDGSFMLSPAYDTNSAASPTSVVSADVLAAGKRSVEFGKSTVTTPSEDSTVSELIRVIHHQHQKIQSLAKELSKVTLEQEDSAVLITTFHSLLHRGSEAAHATWKKNEKREKELIKLEEKLRALKNRHNLPQDSEVPLAHRRQAEELRPHQWLMTLPKCE